jgi:hypothetical protein
MFVQASSTPRIMSIRSFSDNGNASRKLRTNFRISARLAVWLENSTFLFFIRPAAAPGGASGSRTENLVDSLSNHSSVSVMWKSLVAILLLVSPAMGQETPSAYEALRTMGTQLNRAMVSRVISVSGVDGDPQPRTWKILVADRNSASGAREITVEENQVIDQRLTNKSVVGSTSGATIKTALLNLDSTGAYAVANHTAETSHVTFKYVSYILRSDDHGSPVWVVTLEDRSRRPVGTIHIKAHDGRISRVEGMYRGRNMEQVEEEGDLSDDGNGKSDQEDADENVVTKNVKRWFRQTRDESRRIFGNVKRSFQDFANKWE